MADRVVLLRRRRVAPIIGLVLALAVVAIGVSYATTAARSASGSDSLRTATVARGSVDQALTLTGTVARLTNVTAHFPVSGTVTGVKVAVGDQVTAGQALATMDTGSLQQSVLDAQASLDQAKATLASDVTTASTSSSSTTTAASSGGSTARSTAAATTSGAGAGGGSGPGSGSGAGAANDPSAALAAVKAAQAAVATACAAVLGTPASPPASPSATATSTAPPSSTATATATATSTATSTETATTTATSTSTSTGPTTEQLAACLAALQALSAAEAKAGAALQAYSGSLTAEAAALKASQAAAAQAAAAQAAAAAKAAAAAAAARAQGQSAGGGGTVTEARLITDRANVSNAEAALTKAQDNLAGATLTAPIDGRVGAIAWAVGDTASSANGIQLIGSGAAKVTVQVPQANLPTVSVGQAAHVTVPGLAALDGNVSEVALLPTSSSSSSTPTYAVDVVVAGAPDELGSGGRATVTIVIKHVDNALRVPASAVTLVSSGTGTVGLLRNGTVSAASVQTGATGGGWVEILTGLAAGDVVVLGDTSQPLPSNGGFGGGGGLGGGGLGGNVVRVPGVNQGGPPGGG